MKNVTMSGLVLAVLLIPMAAYAGFFDSVKKSAGIQEDVKVQLGTKEVCEMLSEYDGTTYDPYKEKKLEYTKINVPQVDDFTEKSVKMNGRMEIVSKLLEETQKEIDSGTFDKDAVSKRLDTVVGVLTMMAAKAPELVSSGQTLATSLPSILAGPNALKIESITNSVKASIVTLTEMPGKAQTMIEQVKGLLTKVSAAGVVDAAAGAIPDAPAIPEAPAVPGAPAVPAVPDAPQAPAMPETPKAP